MRNTFVKSLTKIAERDKNVYLLTGDLGFSVFEDFQEKFPQRFVNCGVAEQNMAGVAAGLALNGKKPYLYSIVPFVTLRCLEQIKNDICYQNLNVKIVGVGGGFSYGTLGATHYAIEDLAVLRSLPNMTVICPADPLETDILMEKAYNLEGPVYLRLGRSGEGDLYKERPDLRIGEPSVLKEGKKTALIATGTGAEAALKASEGRDWKVISLHTLKPINREKLLKELEGIDKVFTVEEHNVIGGLGSAAAEVLAESEWKGSFERIGVPDQYPSLVGSAEYLRDKYNLNAKKIAELISKKT